MKLRMAVAAVIIGAALITWAAERASPAPEPVVATASTTTSAAPATTSSKTELPASTSPTTCTVWLQGHDAYATFVDASQDIAPFCASWVQRSAAGGQLWIEGMEPADLSRETVICQLIDGNAQATISDEAGGSYGQDACERLLAAGGWTELPG
jgi:hypothetical protein